MKKVETSWTSAIAIIVVFFFEKNKPEDSKAYHIYVFINTVLNLH